MLRDCIVLLVLWALVLGILPIIVREIGDTDCGPAFYKCIVAIFAQSE